MKYVYLEDIVFKISTYPNLPKEINQCASCYKFTGTWVQSAEWEYMAADGKRSIYTEMDVCFGCALNKAIYSRVKDLIQEKANEVAIEASKNTGR